MARLAALALASLDGYMADAAGDFSWAMPDDEVHRFVNDLHRPIGTFLLGRRIYEVLQAWEDMDLTDEPEPIVDFAALWHATDKIVYTATLTEPSTARTRIERRFDPEEVRRQIAHSARDLLIGGPTLAAAAARAGLIDDWHVFLYPVLVGSGLRFWPADVAMPLQLAAERVFPSGVVYLHYRGSGR